MDVVELQSRLNCLGETLSSRAWDRSTKAALRRFQQRGRLRPTGELDYATVMAIRKATIVTTRSSVAKPNGHRKILRNTQVFWHSGDFGDIIYALPTIRALGGGTLVLGPCAQRITRLPMTLAHVNVLRPLLELQPYVSEVKFSAEMPRDVDVDLNKFRDYLDDEHNHMARGARRLNLAEIHLHTFMLPLAECDRAWLVVDKVEAVPGRPVLVHRSSRWCNLEFPWKRIMDLHAHQAIFVGLESEHASFVKDWGVIPFRPTNNFLELARLIAGCRLYVGNQSLPYAICEGLKQDGILEVWPEGPNCLFNRRNVIHGQGRTVYVPKLETIAMNTMLNFCPACETSSALTVPVRDKADIVRCSECSLVYLRTQPDKEQTLLYYQQYADDHSHMRLPKSIDEIQSSGLRRGYFMQELMEFVKPPGSMLDIGCGWGAFLAHAREKGFVPHGLDVCHKAAHFSLTILGIQTVCAELEDYPTSHDGTHDVVVAIHTLEHLANLSYVLTRIHQLLKPGGIFGGIVPNFESFCSHVEQDSWPWLDANTHYVHFGPATLRYALERHGFKMLKCYTHTGDYDRADLQRLLEQREGNSLTAEELKACVKDLWETGKGEEIRFFAIKVC
jgi:ubiquinone/menaquinone biosynthesis C-methylase UbiE/Zn ribbon nucleic-acid-binding protein